MEEAEKDLSEYLELSKRAESAPDSTGIIEIDIGSGLQPNLHIPVTPDGYRTTKEAEE